MMRIEAGACALQLGQVTSPLGRLLLAADSAGRLYGCEFADREERLHRLLRQRLGNGGYALQSGPAPASAAMALERYFGGEIRALDALTLEMAGSRFQTEVWRALRAIAPGAPLSYGALAKQLGRPDAARAIGHANASNPFEIIIPCHRLVAADGRLTGYAGGLERKRWLLAHEAAHAGAWVWAAPTSAEP